MNYPQYGQGQQGYGQSSQYGQGYAQDNDKIGDQVLVLVPAHHNGGVPVAVAHVTAIHSHGSGNRPAFVSLRVIYNSQPGSHHRDAREFLENIPLFDTEADLFAFERGSSGDHFYGAFYTAV